DVNAPARGYYGRTVLQAAASHGHLEIVRLLLAAAVDPNAPGAITRAARHCSSGPVQRVFGAAATAGGGHAALMRELIAMPGMVVNMAAGRDGGRTALQAAAEGGFRDVVELLLHAGASVNAPPVRYKGLTALQGTATAGKLDAINVLLAHGADVDAPGCYYHGYTALSAAAERGSVEVVRRLLEVGADVRAVSGDAQRMAMHSALLFSLYSTYNTTRTNSSL
ncbi:ankyrin repeat-containing domain protein, partial [Mycena vulgaris]